jgi:hypothetical protein
MASASSRVLSYTEDTQINGSGRTERIVPEGHNREVVDAAMSVTETPTNERHHRQRAQPREAPGQRHVGMGATLLRSDARAHQRLRRSDLLSEAQLSLNRRAASIECELERLDALLSRGAEVDLAHLRRLFEVL